MRAADESEAARPDGQEETLETRAGGLWPSATEQQAALLVQLVELGRVERIGLRAIEPDPLRRAQIVDRASELMMRRVLRGTPPEHPRAWFRRVVDRFTKSKKIPFGRKHMEIDQVGDLEAPGQFADSSSPNSGSSSDKVAWLGKILEKLDLTVRERAILSAALDYSSNRAAAKSLAMSAWNFRRGYGKLVEKIAPRIRAEARKNARVFEPPPPT